MIITEAEAKLHHCGALARTLRAEHREILEHMQVPTHKELREAFEASPIRRSWFLDGKLAAMAGVTGPLASSDGVLWMALTDEMAQHPVPVGRRARRLVDQVMRYKRRLTTSILKGDKAGMDFAHFLGFMVEGREPVNGVPAVQMSYSIRKAA